MLGVALAFIGFVGIVMPALPGQVLIFAGLLLVAWADHFTRVGPWTLTVIGVIGATSYVADFMAAAVGVKRLGASPRAMTGAALGTFAGLLSGLPGIVIGPFVGALVGALVGELTLHRDWKRAGHARGCGVVRIRGWHCGGRSRSPSSWSGSLSPRCCCELRRERRCGSRQSAARNP